jgi:hypothetical protein
LVSQGFLFWVVVQFEMKGPCQGSGFSPANHWATRSTRPQAQSWLVS